MSEANGEQRTSSWLGGASSALRIAQVRLRFVFVLLAVFLVVSQWEAITSRWQSWMGRFGAMSEQGVSSTTEYFCPMCPGVISAWPAPCPVCSMPLVRRKKGEMGILPDGALVRMQISPYRLQLGGIATTDVEYRELRLAYRLAEVAEKGVAEEAVFVAQLEPYRSQPRGLPDLAPDESQSVHICPNHPQQVSAEAGRCPLDGSTLIPRMLAANERLRWSCSLHPQNIAERPGGTCAECAGLPLVPTVVAFAPERAVLAIPESAVIEAEGLQVVFQESSPGVFDAMPVELGASAGGYRPVIAGLRRGARVVSQGAFLLDAETRLDPHLAATYFGADTRQPASSDAGDASPSLGGKADVADLLAKLPLSEAQRALALRQRTCPITNLPLGSMGAPVAASGAGKTVLLCCEGCRQRFDQQHASTVPAQPVPQP